MPSAAIRTAGWRRRGSSSSGRRSVRSRLRVAFAAAVDSAHGRTYTIRFRQHRLLTTVRVRRGAPRAVRIAICSKEATATSPTLEQARDRRRTAGERQGDGPRLQAGRIGLRSCSGAITAAMSRCRRCGARSRRRASTCPRRSRPRVDRHRQVDRRVLAGDTASGCPQVRSRQVVDHEGRRGAVAGVFGSFSR